MNIGMESIQFCFWPVGDPSLRLPGHRASSRGSRWPEAREGTPPGGAGRGGLEPGARRRGCPRGLGGRRSAEKERAVGCEPGASSPGALPGVPALPDRPSSAGSGRAERREARGRGGRRAPPGTGQRLPRGAPRARGDRRGRRRSLSASTPGCRRGDGHGSRPWPCPRPCRSLSAPRAHGRPGQCEFEASRRSGTWRGESSAPLILVPSLPCRGALTPRCRGQMGGAPSPGLGSPEGRKFYCTVVCGTAWFWAEENLSGAAASLYPGKHQLPT